MRYCSICRGRGRIYAGGRWVRCGNCNKRPTKQEQETYLHMNRQATQEELENIRAVTATVSSSPVTPPTVDAGLGLNIPPVPVVPDTSGLDGTGITPSNPQG